MKSKNNTSYFQVFLENMASNLKITIMHIINLESIEANLKKIFILFTPNVYKGKN